MVRELAVSMYLTFFRIVFTFFKMFPQKKKAFFMTYLGYNALHTLEAMENLSDESIIVVKTKHCHVDFKEKNNTKIIDLTVFNLLKWLQFVFHLATSDKIIVDNYYGFLAVTDFKSNTVCVQLWHAAGALKKFGLLDLSVQDRSERAKKRFKRVYARFDHVVVGSDKMGKVFQDCFGLSEDKILRTGIPRTDFFFDQERVNDITITLYRDYPLLRDKKVILYAPTFRDNESEISSYSLSIQQMKEAFGDEYVLLIKNHPIVKNNSVNEYPDFVLNMSHYENINHLLLITDILISDYSSVPFEYALLEKPMIFYSYDLEEYGEKRGLWDDYKEMIPGPLAKTTEEVIDIIQYNRFDQEQIVSFKRDWNTYSNGRSGENLARFIYQKDTKRQSH